MGQDVLWADANRLAKGVDRLLVPPEAGKEGAEIVVKVRNGGCELNGLAEECQRFIMPAKLASAKSRKMNARRRVSHGIRKGCQVSFPVIAFSFLGPFSPPPRATTFSMA